MTTRRIVLQTDAMREIEPRPGITYTTQQQSEPLVATAYAPVGPANGALPAVILVTGYSDPGFAGMMGCTQPEMASNISWAELLASSGMIAFTYENVEPLADAGAIFNFVRAQAADLGVDPDRIGVWSCSGNVPTALGMLAREPAVRCAALCYGYMLDQADGASTPVADAAELFRFANPGVAAQELPDAMPTLVVKAGRDEMPGLNQSIDAFMSHAVSVRAPVRLLHLPESPHAFDLDDDSDASRVAISEIVSFLATELGVEP